MRRNAVIVLLSLVAIAFAAGPALATTVLYVPLERSVELSDVIVVGHVLSLEADYNAEGEIVTRVHVLVEEVLKGQATAGEVFTFDAWGGSLDGVKVETVGEARYRLGDKVLVQLESIAGEYHTLGLSFGKWDVFRGEGDEPILRRSLGDLNMVGVSEVPIEIISLRTMRQTVRQSWGGLDH